MKVGITYRLFLAMLIATALAVVAFLLIMQWSIDRGFLQFINNLEQARMARLAERLEESYAEQGSWEFLRHDPAQWRRLLAASLPDEGTPPAPGEPAGGRPLRPTKEADAPPGPPPPRFARLFDRRVLLLDARRHPIFGPPDVPETIDLRPLQLQSQVVGYLGLLPRRQVSDSLQLRFLRQQKFALVLVAGVVVLLAAGLSLPLARRLVRPIRALASATHRLAAGQFDIRVPVGSSDELGHLARDFNSLAVTLEKNEQARRQWVADISHELRTPLAVLRGEIEALQDGIRQPTPDSVRSLHGEVLRLSRLVDDLYQLSLSDLGALTYRKENLDVAELLTEALTSYRPELAQKEIRLTLELPRRGKAKVFGDPERLHQLFANVLDNALKYTDAGGALAIRLDVGDGQARLDFQDSAPGVPESKLERLFDRLYRVETSRNRAAGGAGLGLAICRNIVEAHAGRITAQPSPLGGVWIRITLPLTETS
jgi:two-component system sensor histidine kinase BaeS